MKLWLIWQSENNDYDTFDSAVVVADSSNRARRIHPESGWEFNKDDPPIVWPMKREKKWDYPYRTWASHPKHVKAKLIGEAEQGAKEGVVLASFNAG